MKFKEIKMLIRTGLISVYGPIVLFVVSCCLLSNYIAVNIVKSSIADFIVTVTLFISIVVGWVWWSYKIVKWKVWAFSQVDLQGAYDLYNQSIECGLIWPAGSFFNRTEIWTKKDMVRWNDINSNIRSVFTRK